MTTQRGTEERRRCKGQEKKRRKRDRGPAGLNKLLTHTKGDQVKPVGGLTAHLSSRFLPCTFFGLVRAPRQYSLRTAYKG